MTFIKLYFKLKLTKVICVNALLTHTVWSNLKILPYSPALLYSQHEQSGEGILAGVM